MVITMMIINPILLPFITVTGNILVLFQFGFSYTVSNVAFADLFFVVFLAQKIFNFRVGCKWIALSIDFN